MIPRLKSAVKDVLVYVPNFLRPRWHRARIAARRPVRPGWAVQATVDEPLPLLRAFAAHHLEMGAEEVHLFLDRDDPELATALRVDGRVRVTVCNSEYWRVTHWRARPVLHTSRQVVNATRAYRDTEFEWMLFADADEFLVCDGDFADILRDAPDDWDLLRIPVAERCYEMANWPRDTDTLYGGIFRRAMGLGPKRARDIYGPDAAFLQRGVLAHHAGKSVVRTRRVYYMGLHWPKPFKFWGGPPKIDGIPAYQTFQDGAYIVHYDGLTPRHWLLKLVRKYQLAARAAGAGQPVDLANRTDARKRQIMAVHDARNDAAALMALTRMQALSPKATRQLRKEAGLVDVTLDPDAAAARHYPDHGAPTVGAFDAALIARYADLIAEFGLDIS